MTRSSGTAASHATSLRPAVASPSHLAVSGLTVSYGGTSLALDDVTLEVPPGARVALLGANGAGKTTLVRAVTGMTRFHRARVLRGKVEFGDSVITGESAASTTKRGITQVPEGRQMFGHLTVEENLQLGGLTGPKRGLNQRVEEALSFFPALGDKRKRHAGLLSGGEQQMVALARALVATPQLLVIDELTLGLSPVMVETVVELLLDVLERTGAGLLLVEQNAQLALDVCEHAYVLDRGVVTTSGPAAELSGDTRVQDAYLGRRRDDVSPAGIEEGTLS